MRRKGSRPERFVIPTEVDDSRQRPYVMMYGTRSGSWIRDEFRTRLVWRRREEERAREREREREEKRDGR